MSFVDHRAVKRDSLFLTADLVLGLHQAPVTVRVRNLSATGMMVEGDLRLRAGGRLVAHLRNLAPVRASVVWSDGRRTGIAFDTPVDASRARTQVFGGHREAPIYARAAVAAPRHDGWNGRLRRV